MSMDNLYDLYCASSHTGSNGLRNQTNRFALGKEGDGDWPCVQ